MPENDGIICYECNVPLVDKRTEFQYLGHHFFAEIPCCPICGISYVSKELAKGKMSEVERQLEEK